MAKLLPYFRWYPADADTDEAYSALTDTELGFFHRCLNKAWMNDGLPADPDELARVMRVTREYFDSVWPRVSKMFRTRPEDGNRIVNRRQEEERLAAFEKSERNKRPGNANATREKRDRVPIANETRSDRDANETRSPRVKNAIDPQHAGARAESVCVSESESEKEITNVREFRKLEVQPSSRFEELWEQWPRKFGRDAAERDFFDLVTTANEQQVFACVDRYLSSGEVSRGAVKNLGSVASGGSLKPGWLADCARDNWKSDWPRAPSSTQRQEARMERVCNGMELFDLAEGRT